MISDSEQLDYYRNQLSLVKQIHESDLVTLEASYKSKSEHIAQRFNQHISEQNKFIQTLQNSLSQQNQVNSELQSQLQELESVQKSQENTLKNRIKDLDSSIKSVKSEINQIKLYKESLNKQEATLSSDFSTKVHEISQEHLDKLNEKRSVLLENQKKIRDLRLEREQLNLTSHH